MQDEELDRLLEDALADYGAAEPRAGLEYRVLARVRADKLRPAIGWLAISTLTASAALFFCWPRPAEELIAPKPALVRAAVLEPEKPVTVARAVAVRRKRFPKLDQFPRKSPLTEQERLFIQLVTQAPERAKSLLVNQTQTIEPVQIRELKIADLKQND